jgi:hypothetical protein
MVPLRLNLPTDAVGRDRHWGGVSLSCPQCGTISQQPALGLISTLPAVERFWREHRRIRVAAQVQMDGGENPLVRTRFESRTRAVALEIVTRRDTFDVVDILSA